MNIKIPQKAKVKVYWDDKPENYSRQTKLGVRDYFSNKYGISKNNIEVIYRPIKVGKNGEVIEISGAGIENILDKNYQVELMKEWFKREEKKVNFKRVLDLDKKVNDSLENQSEIINNRSWALKWLYIDNFLCFGNKNFISFGNLKGLNIVTSEPANQGGKTTFSVDAIKFLLFGKTTKTDKNEQIFNTYTDKNELTVRGMLEVEGKEIIIERKLSRKAKRTVGWNTTNKVNYYELLPDGEELLLNDEDSKKTGQLIIDNVGTEKDFDTTILTTARNLEDLIDAKPTESGRLLTKFIGLEIIENKEIIAKKLYSDFNKLKKGNHYNINDLLTENSENENKIKVYEGLLTKYKVDMLTIENSINRLNSEKERLLNCKLNIDSEISQLNPENIQSDINKITEKGLEYKKRIGEYEKKIKEIINISYDEYLYDNLETKSRNNTIKIGALKNDVIQYGKVIANLEDSEICQSCKRPLENIDNSEAINEYKNKIKETNLLINKHNVELKKINDSISKIKENREIVDRRNRLELEKDKAEVEIGSLRNKMVSKKADLKKYKANKDAIKINIEIDSDISSVKTDIIIQDKKKTDLNQEIFTIKNSVKNLEVKTENNIKLIKTLKKEVEVEKIFKVYLEMVGKKGISKLVLRSVLPIINSELQRLLDDVCNFEIELTINSRNEVEYRLIKSDVIKSLKSGSGLERTIASLALRCVLGKISHLPTPNFVTFDEVLGKVAAVNIEKLKPMFEKITKMFDIIFFISHNDLVKDWSSKSITVIKENDISRISIGNKK